MGEFSPQDLGTLPPAAMGGFDPRKFGALPPAAMKGFKPEQFEVFHLQCLVRWSRNSLGSYLQLYLKDSNRIS